MSNNDDSLMDDLEYEAARPVIRPHRRSPSLVWLIPIIAAALGGWLVVHTILERGPEITIYFASAEGLKSGKTELRYKNVSIGVVESVALESNLQGVAVTARIDKKLEPHLRENSRFWVVRPRVSTSGVSGLGTLISGAYIELEPGSGELTSEFWGLAHPPVSPADAPGRKLLLRSSNSSISPGSPVLYRGIEVGQVESRRLHDEQIEIEIYIEESFAALVRRESKFWNVSGADLAINTKGVQFKAASVESILRGGIAFETPVGQEGGAVAVNGDEFQLYSRHSEIGEEYLGESYEFILYFENSVRGLSKGAPVEFRGIKIGVVTDVALEYDVSRMWLQIPVRIRLEPGRMRALGDDKLTLYETISIMVQRGMRAQVASGSLLTGALYITLDFDGDAPLEFRGRANGPPEIPTLERGPNALMASATEFVDRLNELPLERLFERGAATLEQGTATLARIDRLVIKIDGQLDPLMNNVKGTTKAATQALLALRAALPEGSVVQNNLNRALSEMTAASAAVRRFADMIEREPESLLRGKR